MANLPPPNPNNPSHTPQSDDNSDDFQSNAEHLTNLKKSVDSLGASDDPRIKFGDSLNNQETQTLSSAQGQGEGKGQGQALKPSESNSSKEPNSNSFSSNNHSNQPKNYNNGIHNKDADSMSDSERQLNLIYTRMSLLIVDGLIPRHFRYILEGFAVSSLTLFFQFLNNQSGPDDFIKAAIHWAAVLFEKLCLEIPLAEAKKISKQERTSFGLSSVSLVYGEIQFDSFSKIFQLPSISQMITPNHKKFIDLGSGVGKPVFAAALLLPCHEFKGIEILSGLFSYSMKLKERYEKEIVPLFPYQIVNPINIQFEHGSFTQIPWDDGDIIFVNSTCYATDLLDHISSESKKLKDGSIVILLTKQISADHLIHKSSTLLNMSWGSATVHVYSVQQVRI